jgi:hypothetical protein
MLHLDQLNSLALEEARVIPKRKIAVGPLVNGRCVSVTYEIEDRPLGYRIYTYFYNHARRLRLEKVSYI